MTLPALSHEDSARFAKFGIEYALSGASGRSQHPIMGEIGYDPWASKSLWTDIRDYVGSIHGDNFERGLRLVCHLCRFYVTHPHWRAWASDFRRVDDRETLPRFAFLNVEAFLVDDRDPTREPADCLRIEFMLEDPIHVQ